MSRLKKEVSAEGVPCLNLNLSALEFDLLRFFIEHQDQVMSRNSILDEVWGDDVYIQPRTVDKHIAELRKNIEDDPSNPKHMLGVRGVGYKFCE
ncbi:MAG: helix-turn-helix domain-containing protein [Candidatus Aminicenantes bacterium]